MNQGRTVFSQLISFLPDREFRRCVERYQGELRLRGFSCWDQYLAMARKELLWKVLLAGPLGVTSMNALFSPTGILVDHASWNGGVREHWPTPKEHHPFCRGMT